MVREVNLGSLNDLLLLISSQSFFWWKMAGRNKTLQRLLRHWSPKHFRHDWYVWGIFFCLAEMVGNLQKQHPTCLYCCMPPREISGGTMSAYHCTHSTHRIFLVASKDLAHHKVLASLFLVAKLLLQGS